MRITVPHNQPKEQAMRAVDRSFDDLFRGISIVPLQISNEKRTWQGDILHFSLVAKAGLLSAPIKGFVEVSAREIIVDADLGWLEKLLPARQTRAVLQSKIRGLLR